jgi:hypothetical protein
LTAPEISPLGPCLVFALHAVEQHRELVATESRSGVGWAHERIEPGRHPGQEPVTRAVAEAVVDRLEVVKVEGQDCERSTVPQTAGERMTQPVLEQGPVRQAGERIVERRAAKLILERLARADIAHVEHQPLDRGTAATIAPTTSIDSTPVTSAPREICAVRERIVVNRGRPTSISSTGRRPSKYLNCVTVVISYEGV